MNRDQWFQLLCKHHVVQDEIVRIMSVELPDVDVDVLGDLLDGLVQCCANVASQIDSTRKDTPNV